MKDNILEKIKKIQRNIKINKIFTFLFFIIYLGLIILVSSHHEAWEDESQAWLIARDLNFLDIIKQMRFEGHSFFWYYILTIFAKTGISYEFSKIVMIIIATFTGIFVLTKAPYRGIVKILILFSPVFLYYMPVFLRPYSIIALMLIIISIMNEAPEKYPILYGVAIAILANTHIIVLGISFFIYVFFFKEQFLDKYKENTKNQNIKLIIGAVIAILGMLTVVFCAVAGYIFSIAATHGSDVPEVVLLRCINYFKELFNVLIGIKLPDFVIFIGYLGLLISIIIQSIKVNKKQGLIFFFGLIFYLFVQTFIFGIFTNQRTVLPFIFLLYFSWNIKRDCINKNKLELLEIAIFIICILSIPNTIRVIKDEIKYPYNDSKNVAEYIEENIEEGSTFITVNWDSISSVEVYLSGKDYKFYDATDNTYMTYAVWNKFLDKEKDSYIENAIKNFENEDIYVLNLISNESDIMDLNSFNKSKEKLELLYYTNEKCLARKAYLYKIIK